jgi:hypothetical protein
LLPPDDVFALPDNRALTADLASFNPASTKPSAVRAPLKSLGFDLSAPKILIVGKPYLLNNTYTY